MWRRNSTISVAASLNRMNPPRVLRRIRLELHGVCTGASVAIMLLVTACGAVGSSAPHSIATATTSLTPTVPTLYVSDDSVYALDQRNGALQWQYAVEDIAPIMFERFPSPAVAADGRVFFTTLNTLVALGASQRAAVWKQTLDGRSVGLTVSNGTVYVAAAGEMEAFQARTGVPLWRFTSPTALAGPPTAGGGAVYAATVDGSLYAVNSLNGTERWRYHTSAVNWSAVDVGGGFLLAAGDNRDGPGSCLDALNSVSGALVWEHCLTAGGAGKSGRLALSSDAIYVGTDDGTLFSIKTADGALLWQARMGGPILSAPVASGQFVYCSSRDGTVSALRYDTGAVVWRTRTSGLPREPLAVNDMVYVDVIVPGNGPVQAPPSGHVVALKAANGQTVWTYPLAYTPAEALAVGS